MIPQNHLQKPWRIATAFRMLILLSLLAFLATPSASLAAFPGTNGKIAFVSTRDGTEQIYTMNANGSGVTQLTFTLPFNSFPEWSADGTKIVFESGRDGNHEIYIMNADGSGQTRLTNNSAIDNVPTWSPDGAKIAFISQRDGNEEIYVMNADGTGQTNLTNHSASDAGPAWSPDGTKIAFSSNRNGFGQIFVMNTDGSMVTQLTTLGNNGSPNWSPDGSKIAFHSDRNCGGCGTPFDVYVMNADGSGQTQLAFDAVYSSAPAWSPDGTKIVFESQRDGNYEVYVMNTDGSGQTNLTNNSAVDLRPDWGPVTQLDPSQVLEHSSDSLQAILDANPSTRLANKVGDADAKLQVALDELAKTPPDVKAAVRNIERAVGDLESAVEHGLLDFTQGVEIMDQLALIARSFALLAIEEFETNNLHPRLIQRAQESLYFGDFHREEGNFKKAI